MRNFRSLGVLILLAAAQSAFGQKIEAKSYMDVPPGTYKTYHWHPGKTLSKTGYEENPDIEAAVKQSVERQMAAKGFQLSPDGFLEISYMAGSTTNVRHAQEDLNDNMQWVFGAPFGYSGHAYQKSALVITAVDVRGRKTVWAAKATDNFKPKDLQAKIDKAVTKAFEKFPVKP